MPLGSALVVRTAKYRLSAEEHRALCAPDSRVRRIVLMTAARQSRVSIRPLSLFAHSPASTPRSRGIARRSPELLERARVDARTLSVILEPDRRRALGDI